MFQFGFSKRGMQLCLFMMGLSLGGLSQAEVVQLMPASMIARVAAPVVSQPSVSNADNAPWAEPDVSIQRLSATGIASDKFWQQMIGNMPLMQLWGQKPQVKTQINWYLRHLGVLKDALRRAQYYIAYVYQQTHSKGMPAELALLPVVESDYNPVAYSPAGASGLWQMMPGTAVSQGLRFNWWYDGRADVLTSTQSALDYLQKQYNSKHDWLLALASYNAGGGTIYRAVQRNRSAGKPVDYWDLSIPRETRLYVPRLLAVCWIVAHAKQYGLQLPIIQDHPYFMKLTIDKQLDMGHIAMWSDTDLGVIHMLNPAFRRWATPPGKSTLLLPWDKAKQFLNSWHKVYATWPKVSWVSTRVHAGDTLQSLGEGTGLTQENLMQINQLNSPILRAGQVLIMPIAHGSLLLTSKPKAALSAASIALPAIKKISYRVMAGDSWHSLAKRFGVTISQLQHWNPEVSTLKRNTTLCLKLFEESQAPQSNVSSKVGADQFSSF